MKNNEQVGASTQRTDLDTTLRLCRTGSRPKITILSHTYSYVFHTFSNFPKSNILKPPRVAGGLCPPGVHQGPLWEKVQIAAMTAKVAISVGQGSGRGDGS